MIDLSKYIQNVVDKTYRPDIFRLTNSEDKSKLEKLFEDGLINDVYDTIYSQLTEYAKLRYPAEKLTKEAVDNIINDILQKRSLQDYGSWVYYPWSKKLVHILDREEFVSVRTSRNVYKIFPEEIKALQKKKIGIIGLSVGQSIALTIATERICGEIRLADFDDVELSNMNRIRVGVQDIGISKAVLAAREIAELDPYIDVVLFPEGLNEDNIDDFLSDRGVLDVLVEECDGLDIKILSRLKAKALKIPVVMDTNDRGMLDIERFDLEPDRGLFHGALSDDLDLQGLKSLSNAEKLPLLDAMVDLDSMSERMKYSLSEMGKSVSTWPQLASSVVLGGAMVTDTCRRILLNQIQRSGRYYVDFEEIIK